MKVRAKKQHVCMLCKHVIEVGEIYYYDHYLDENKGKWVSEKMHTACEELYKRSMLELRKQEKHWESWYEQTFY